MSQWLLVGDGPSEIGTADRGRFLQVLLTQLADDNDARLVATLGCEAWESVVLPEMATRTGAQLASEVCIPAPQPKGMALVVARALHAAQILQCDAVVVLVDNDHKPKRRNDLQAGFAGCQTPCAGGVAKEMLEGWIIADGEVLPTPITITKQPEDIWGDKRDPDSEHPKCVLKRALAAAGVDYADVLEHWSVARAAQRAPWLRDFCRQLVVLLRDRQLCTSKAWVTDAD
jgi:hypothetical protein